MLFKIAITQKQTLTGEDKKLNVETNKTNFGASMAAAFSSVNVRLPGK